MKLQLASHMGLCFGVQDALTMALDSVRAGTVHILGPLAHNPVIQDQLSRAGVQFIDKPDQAQEGTILITAHGMPGSIHEEARQTGLTIKDATCPLVQFAHRHLEQLVEEDYYPVIIGRRDHIEVQGMTRDLSSYSVVLAVSDIDSIPKVPRIGIVAQTTQPIERVHDLVDLIRSHSPESEVVFKDTVCQPTKRRQQAALKLASNSDVVVVIGGSRSNNTQQLTQSIARIQPRVHQVERAEELRPHWFDPHDTIGITAGTSTPPETIQAVVDKLRSWEQPTGVTSGSLLQAHHGAR